MCYVCQYLWGVLAELYVQPGSEAIFSCYKRKGSSRRELHEDDKRVLRLAEASIQEKNWCCLGSAWYMSRFTDDDSSLVLTGKRSRAPNIRTVK
jgi:hypothetical protein